MLKKLFPLYYELLVLFLLIHFGIYNSYLFVAAFAINIISILFGSYKIVFAQLFFLLPFSMIYKLSPESSSLFTYGLFFTAFYSLVRPGKKSASLYFGIAIISIYILLDISKDYPSFLRVISGLLCLIAFVNNIKITDIRDVVLSSALGILGASYMGLSKMSNSRLSVYFTDFNGEWMNDEQIFRFSGLMPDPNYYSVSVIVTVFLLLRLIQTRAIHRFWGTVITILLIYFGFLSYSRTYIITIALLGIYFINIMFKTSRYRFVLFVFVVISAIIGWMHLDSSDFYNNMSGRFEEEDLSNGRTSIWLDYINYLTEKQHFLFFGAGFDAKLINGRGTHNAYLEVIYNIGIWGGLLYTALIISILRIRGKFQSGWDKYLLLIIILFLFASLAFYKLSDFYFYLMLIWVSLYYSSEDISFTYNSTSKPLHL